MSFYNLYNKSQGYCYFQSLKIGNSVFSVGQILFDGDSVPRTLITKLDNDGNVVWEKSYFFESNSTHITNYQMVECTNGDIILVGINHDDEKVHITRIKNGDGTVLWQKKTSRELLGRFDSILSVGNDNYIIVMSRPESEISSNIVLFKIDGSGNIIAKNAIGCMEGVARFKLNGIAKGSYKLGLYGSITFTEEGALKKRAYIFEVDFGLVTMYSRMEGYYDSEVKFMVYQNQSYISFALIDNGLGTFVTRNTINPSTQTIDADVRMHTHYNITNVKSNSNHIFAEQCGQFNTVICKLDYNIVPVWTKRFDHDFDYTDEFRHGILSQVTNNEAIILQGSGIESSPFSDFPIAKLDLDLTSCKTLDTKNINVGDKYSGFEFSDWPFFLTGVKLTFAAIAYSDVENVSSVKFQICEPNPDTECIKDKDICEIYYQLQAIYKNCLIDPILISTETDLNKLAECIAEFIKIIKDFDGKNPKYLLVSTFESQIRFIDRYIRKPDIENYQQVWNAITHILDYFSELGNCSCENMLVIDENTSLQSPNFYLQAAGSIGEDSNKGIHLRWAFSGILGEKHLPKGNYATNEDNFNKPNDFVKVYRAKYARKQFILNLSTPPQTVNDSQQYWLYKFNDDSRIFFVYFKNAAKYNQVRATIDPFDEPIEFIKNYGNDLIEIENKRELFYAVGMNMSLYDDPSSLQLETLSVKENVVFTPKFLSYRKTIESVEIDGLIRVVCENGRSIRFKGNNCLPLELHFEFYSDTITVINKERGWELMGNYALSLSDSLVSNRLDPLPTTDTINGEWLRFNDHAYVNTRNYIDKWSGEVEQPFDRNIKDIVESYITISNDPDNPTGTEFLNLNLTNETPPDPDDPITDDPIPQEEELTEVCNLDILRIISSDYHIARMLGLGALDLGNYETEYLYLAAYTTTGDLGNGPGTVKHLSMSLPTSVFTQRLTLPVELESLVPGFVGPTDNPDDDFVTNNNGYSFDGKKRYVSIVSQDLIENIPNPAFYLTNNDIDFSDFTIPVYAGIENRKVLIGGEDNHIWEKPELSNDPDYLNVDTFDKSYETIPINIPDSGNALYVDIQTETGEYFYKTYGINWFSRATSSEIPLSIKTELKPYNSLLPPSNILPHLIRKEYPLMFTSQLEQDRFDDTNGDDDRTLIRLIFDYNSDHELITYQLPETDSPENFVSDTNSIFPDQYEVMGDYVEVSFRNCLPKKINGRVKPEEEEGITDHSLFMSKISTKNYLQVSNGELLYSQLPEGTTVDNFIGSVFLMGSQQYIIHTVEVGADGLDFIVYKKQLSDGLVDEEIPTLDTQTLQSPFYEGDGYFTVIENMQNNISWGIATNPHPFYVNIGNSDWEIHRELVKSLNVDNIENPVEMYIEKTRGFWEKAKISRFLEEFDFITQDGTSIHKTDTHRGIYKITFNAFQLANGIQTHPHGVSAEWFNGTVRVFTDNNLNPIDGEIYDSRKVFTVFKTENIDTSNNLVLYINDPDFTLDENGEPSETNDFILKSDGTSDVEVNYYPSYKVYLYYDSPHNLTEEQILPTAGEGSRYSIFGLKTVDTSYTDVNSTDPNDDFYKSRYSVPATLVAHEIIAAEIPETPKGSKYATRPDFYGKSTYTFTTEYKDNHKPHGVLFYRADNQGFLSAIYEATKINEIKSALKALGGSDELFFTNRWENFLDFDTLGHKTPGTVIIPEEGKYKLFPLELPDEEKYRFPLPDKTSFFESINKFIAYHNLHFHAAVPLIPAGSYGTMLLNEVIIPAVAGQNDDVKLIDFVKEAVMNIFVQLTEVPVIYKFIKDSTYKPTNKKQRIRDVNGYLLPPPPNPNFPTDMEFDMAPMMKNISPSAAKQKIQFTDFTIDGTTDNVYFYAAKELSSQMKMGEFSSVLGPIKLVNSSPPEAPKIKSTLPILENKVLGITPKMNFEITSYPEVQNIKKINLYRTFERLDANSVQSMKLIKVIDIDIANLTNEAIWTIEDDFSDLPEVPYGDSLYYRLTISRKIEYAEALYNQADEPVIVIEYAPSQPSKIIGTTIVENYVPESPVIDYYSEPLQLPSTDLNFITLHWNETAYKANYHLYKLNSKGNWIEIAKIIADRSTKGAYHYFNTNHPTLTEDWTEEGVIESINGVLHLQLEMTNVNSSNLTVLSADGSKLYHHFKVIAANTSGMFSKKENILTLYNDVTWTDIGGIAVPDRTQGMIVGPTFRVR